MLNVSCNVPGGISDFSCGAPRSSQNKLFNSLILNVLTKRKNENKKQKKTSAELA